jgi:CRP-like cAMP-binding protein
MDISEKVTTMSQQLKLVLNYLTEFNDDELKRISDCFRPKWVKRNTILLHEGEICREFYFIFKGGIRTYFLDKKGKEKTRYFIPSNSIGTALTSFIAQKPSFEWIDALEDTELLSISHQDFYKLNREMVHWKDFYQKILEMAYSFQNKKIKSIMSQTAKERYEQVLNENPSLLQLLSNKILASYLDITPETLSRLKSP